MNQPMDCRCRGFNATGVCRSSFFTPKRGIPRAKRITTWAKMENALGLESAMRDGGCPALQALQAAIGRGMANRLALMRAELI